MAVGLAVGSVPFADLETSITGGVVTESGTSATGGVGAVGVATVLIGEVMTASVLGGVVGGDIATKRRAAVFFSLPIVLRFPLLLVFCPRWRFFEITGLTASAVSLEGDNKVDIFNCTMFSD